MGSKFKSKKSRIIKLYGSDFDINKTYWINPEEIKYDSLKEFDPLKYRGEIIGGDWDSLENKFEDLDVFIAFKERFMDGKDWEDTIFYRRILDRISKRQFLWGCKNKLDWDKRCKNLDLLYQNIKSVGYKSQREILSGNNNYNPLREDEVSINIGRHGNILFNDGAHRLTIAKLLNIKVIPVKIIVRHPQWINYRRRILLYSRI